MRLGAQAQLTELTELLLFGINDVTLSPDIYGTWSISDDTFAFASERTFQGRLIRSRFSGQIQRDPSGRVHRLLLTKTLHDPRLSQPGTWTYRLDYEYRPGPRPRDLPFMVRKFLVQTNGVLRPLDTLTYLRIEVAEKELDPALFEPESFALPASFRLRVSADGLYYVDAQGVTNLVAAPATQDSPASPRRILFYTVLVLLLLAPSAFRYLRRRAHGQ
ncbi:MAG: hypothetical protein D6766_14535 [Verrucomicrobia bacterium]|nr:MAG: hypothetical protein D6766_14535 [Verrucomicrobiota bacterium]